MLCGLQRLSPRASSAPHAAGVTDDSARAGRGTAGEGPHQHRTPGLAELQDTEPPSIDEM
jgi:hypothetical protein